MEVTDTLARPGMIEVKRIGSGWEERKRRQEVESSGNMYEGSGGWRKK